MLYTTEPSPKRVEENCMDAKPLGIFQRGSWKRSNGQIALPISTIFLLHTLSNSGKNSHIQRERGVCFLNISSIRNQIYTLFWGKSTSYFAQDVYIMIKSQAEVHQLEIFHFIISYRKMIRCGNSRFLFNSAKIAISKLTLNSLLFM